MYEAHFGLRARPFGESSPYRRLPGHEAVSRRLRYALEPAEGPALLFGHPGTGKSRLACALAADLGGTPVVLAVPTLPADEILPFLADALDAPPDPGANRTAAIRRLRSAWRDRTPEVLPPFLIVEDAHAIRDPAVFDELGGFLRLAADHRANVRMLLVGGPEAPEAIPDDFADRLSARGLLAPLDLVETATYLSSGLKAADGPSDLFPPETVRAIWAASGGLPRRINRLADLGLLLACAAEASYVNPAMIDAAEREWNLTDLAA